MATPSDTPDTTGETTGTPGAPDATTSVDGNYLPPAPPRFGGEIGLDAKESKPFWPPRVVPPKGAPNILLIMTDDQGYGVSSTFGGVIPTPTLDRVAKAGLRYTHFHSTSLCSPSRAALLTGRNHHSVGFGVLTEQSTGYPGYDAIIGRDDASIGEILKAERLRDFLVRQEPQHAGLRTQFVGTVRSMAERNGLRILLRLHGRRDRPVQAVAVPRSHPDTFRGTRTLTTTSPPPWLTRRSIT